MFLNQPSFPQPPQWYPTQKPVTIKVEKISLGPFEDEVAVLIQLNGESQTAFVPTSAVDQKAKTVGGILVGKQEDFVLIVLPAGSMGPTMLRMESSLLSELVL